MLTNNIDMLTTKSKIFGNRHFPSFDDLIICYTKTRQNVTKPSRMQITKLKMAMDEHSLLQCFNLELPVQTDNSIEQDFL